MASDRVAVTQNSVNVTATPTETTRLGYAGTAVGEEQCNIVKRIELAQVKVVE
jgi:hypothetical protein